MNQAEAHLDYETFSECNLKTAGLWAYARHPSTRILCLSWAIGENEPKIWWPGGSVPAELIHVFKNLKLLAFNAPFELAITKYVGKKCGLPNPSMDQWVDTQAIARMCALPGSLAEVARVLRVPEQKDKRGAQLINFFCKPQKDGRIHLPKDYPTEFRDLCNYCKQDVRTDRSVHHALPIKELPKYEQKVWIEDVIVNDRGVQLDIEMCKGAQQLAVMAKGDAGKNLAKMTKSKAFPNGEITSPGQGKRILAYCTKMGRPLPNLQKDSVAAALEEPELRAEIRDVLELRAVSNITSVAKYGTMLRAVGPDGRIRGVHAYHAATPGRWGGRIAQFQNLPRPAVKLDTFDHQLIRDANYDTLKLMYGNILPVLRDALRNAIIAKPGHELHVVDKASIEARVLGWVSNDPEYLKSYKASQELEARVTQGEKFNAEKLKTLRAALDLYRICAGEIFNKKPEDCTDDERKLGKDSVLGLGYSMGWKKFRMACAKKGIHITAKFAKHVVNVYRSLFKRVPAYWKEVEAACIRCIRDRTVVSLPKGIRVAMHGEHLTVRLPSGRRLWYPFAKLAHRLNKWGNMQFIIEFMTSVNRKWVKSSTYGGKLVENIVQAIARDLLARALLKCEKALLRPVMHVHDEIIGEVLKGRSLQDMHDIFRSPPKWAPDLPLGSGGFISTFYKKG